MPRTFLSAWHIYPSARCNWQLATGWVLAQSPIWFALYSQSYSHLSLSLSLSFPRSLAKLIDLVYDSAVFRSDTNHRDIYFFNILLRFLAHFWQCASKLALPQLVSTRSGFAARCATFMNISTDLAWTERVYDVSVRVSVCTRSMSERVSVLIKQHK